MPDAWPKKIEGLIPHRPPMLVVDELISATGESAESSMVFDENCLFLNAGGQVEEAVLFEMMAQTFAALACLGRGPEEAPSAGFLVGLKWMTLYGPARVGSPVNVNVRIFSRVDDYSVVEGQAFQDGKLLAAGRLTVYVPQGGRV